LYILEAKLSKDEVALHFSENKKNTIDQTVYLSYNKTIIHKGE